MLLFIWDFFGFLKVFFCEVLGGLVLFFSKRSLAPLTLSTDKNYHMDSKPSFDQETKPRTWFRPVFSQL